eukprot:2795269-Amphidinium_carterae.1
MHAVVRMSYLCVTGSRCMLAIGLPGPCAAVLLATHQAHSAEVEPCLRGDVPHLPAVCVIP